MRSTLGWTNLDVYSSPARQKYFRALLEATPRARRSRISYWERRWISLVKTADLA